MILLNSENLCGDCVNAVRKAIESLYKDMCSICELEKVKNPITHVSEKKEVEVYKDVKCRISFSSVSSARKGDTATITQVAKLFISPEIEIKPGSKIVVTHEGVTTAYQRSGVPAIYSNHQEIVLDLFKEYA